MSDRPSEARDAERNGETTDTARSLLPAILVPLCAVLLVLGASTVANALNTGRPGTVYPLGALLRHVQQDPARWLGRRVRVRAVAVPCAATLSGPGSPCLDPRPVLLDPRPVLGSALLPLAQVPTPDALTWLHRLPLVRLFDPGPPSPVWGIASTYTVLVQRVPCAAGDTPPCVAARLL